MGKIVRFRKRDARIEFDFSKSPCTNTVSKIAIIPPKSHEKVEDNIDTFMMELCELLTHMTDPMSQEVIEAARIVVRAKHNTTGVFSEATWRALPTGNFILEMAEMIETMTHEELKVFAMRLMEKSLQPMMDWIRTGTDAMTSEQPPENKGA